jgi:hypothetical protein
MAGAPILIGFVTQINSCRYWRANSMSTRPQPATASAEWWKTFEVGIKRCSEIYRTELGAAALEAYAEILNLLSPHVLAESITLAISRCRFMPKPAEILNCSREVLERMTTRGMEASEDCELCRGTSWKLIQRPDGKGSWATGCDCRVHGAKK